MKSSGGIDERKGRRPLDGIRVIEMAGLAPSPYCGMLLCDFGADVVVVDRLSKGGPEIPNIMAKNPFDRGKRSIRVNLKAPEGVDIVRRMIGHSDVLIEPYRPGVMETLGLGPVDALALNGSLIYARLTGWGQEGPYSGMAGHDIDYIALSGALSLFRRKGEKPLPPCNTLGDFAGGGMLCAMGILLALFERERSGEGQVVDAAMVDGASSLITLFYGLLGNRLMTPDIGTNLLDSGAPFYETYETADGKFLAVGAIEGRFYAEMLKGLAVDPDSVPHQYDMAKWTEMKDRLTEVFKTRTRDEWMAVFDGMDACVAPILELDEVQGHPHNRARGLLITLEGLSQPAPAPRLSRTPGRAEQPGAARGADTRAVLGELGFDEEEMKDFFTRGVAE
jgi:alpha-methylacyl-CoA racemase